MTATPSPKGVEPKEPEPIICECGHDADFHMNSCRVCPCKRSDNMIYKSAVATLTAERDEARGRAEAAGAENVRLTEFMKRAHGNLAAALIAPSAKLETD